MLNQRHRVSSSTASKTARRHRSSSGSGSSSAVVAVPFSVVAPSPLPPKLNLDAILEQYSESSPYSNTAIPVVATGASKKAFATKVKTIKIKIKGRASKPTSKATAASAAAAVASSPAFMPKLDLDSIMDAYSDSPTVTNVSTAATQVSHKPKEQPNRSPLHIEAESPGLVVSNEACSSSILVGQILKDASHTSSSLEDSSSSAHSSDVAQDKEGERDSANQSAHEICVSPRVHEQAKDHAEQLPDKTRRVQFMLPSRSKSGDSVELLDTLRSVPRQRPIPRRHSLQPKTCSTVFKGTIPLVQLESSGAMPMGCRSSSNSHGTGRDGASFAASGDAPDTECVSGSRLWLVGTMSQLAPSLPSDSDNEDEEETTNRNCDDHTVSPNTTSATSTALLPIDDSSSLWKTCGCEDLFTAVLSDLLQPESSVQPASMTPSQTQIQAETTTTDLKPTTVSLFDEILTDMDMIIPQYEEAPASSSFDMDPADDDDGGSNDGANDDWEEDVCVDERTVRVMQLQQQPDGWEVQVATTAGSVKEATTPLEMTIVNSVDSNEEEDCASMASSSSIGIVSCIITCNKRRIGPFRNVQKQESHCRIDPKDKVQTAQVQRQATISTTESPSVCQQRPIAARELG